MPITNPKLAKHEFLASMYEDAYFPDNLVDKAKQILVELCENIEAKRPANLAELYALTHAATERFNDLQQEFEEQGSEIETGAREAIAEDFEIIAHGYGFADADMEELIAPRDW